MKAQSRRKVRTVEETESNTGFPPFKDSLPYQAQLLSRLTQNDYLGRIQETGVAPAQAYVLGELWLMDNISQVELARRLDIGKATVGQTLTRLERAGLVRRRRIAEDRRIVLVSLTEKGRALRDPLKQASIDQMKFLTSHFDADFLETLAESLKRVNAVMMGEDPERSGQRGSR